MNSRFYFPTNTDSLGSSRRTTSVMNPIGRLASVRSAPDDNSLSAMPFSPKPTVLIVEDDDNTLFMLKSVLTTKGYRVLEAWDGKQAVEMAETHNPDLMLLDIQLPRLNGLGVIHRLRENPKLESLPIVVVTGLSPEEYRGSAITSGCDDFLMKPIDFDRLDVLLNYYAPIPIEPPPAPQADDWWRSPSQ